ncbi:MAG: hypothetical protein K2K80_05320 [Clostridia bacterium]|nr:hypothetical protein [Clostridia bacterium]
MKGGGRFKSNKRSHSGDNGVDDLPVHISREREARCSAAPTCRHKVRFPFTGYGRTQKLSSIAAPVDEVAARSVAK